jgi:hypothetical protein
MSAPQDPYYVERAAIEAERVARAREFVKEYVALCNRHKAEVSINTHGVHCVVLDEGRAWAFKSVYPEWEEDEEEEEPSDFEILVSAWKCGTTIQYLQVNGYDSEWTDYAQTGTPEECPSSLAWRVKP